MVTRVTRCWNKSFPKCLKLPKKKPQQVYPFKGMFFKLSQKSQKDWDTFVRKLSTENFGKLPNLVTLKAKLGALK